MNRSKERVLAKRWPIVNKIREVRVGPAQRGYQRGYFSVFVLHELGSW